MTSSGEDIYEENDDMAHAYILSPNSTIFGNAMDHDFYNMTLTPGTDLKIELIYVGDGINVLWGNIYDANGQPIGDILGSSYKNSTIISFADTISVCIEIWSLSSEYQYTLIVTEVTGIEDDIYEENDDPDHATPIFNQTIINLVWMDYDLFNVTVTEGDILTIYIAYTATGQGMGSALYDPNQNMVALEIDTTDSGFVMIYFPTNKTGSYMIAIYADDVVDSYSLTVMQETPEPVLQDDMYEENDNPTQAYPIFNATLSGLACLDNDFFNISVNVNDTIKVTITYIAAGQQMGIGLLNPTLTIVNQTSDTTNLGTVTLTYKATMAGNHSIFVYTVMGQVASYDLTVVHILAPNPNIAPVILSPGNITVNEGQIGNKIEWTVLDTTVLSASYMVLKNETVFATGSWANGTIIQVNLNGLAAGVYFYKLIIVDGLGASANNTVKVTVIPTVPTINTPDDVIYIEGITGNIIEWIILDGTVGVANFTIYLNDVQVDTGFWTSGEIIDVSVDGFAIGVHTVMINATDGLGHYVTDTVYVIVLIEHPTINSPADLSYNINTTGHSFTWIITDNTIGTTAYVITRNETEILDGIWVNGTEILVNVDGLLVGKYIFQITATDGLGGSSSDIVVVYVFPEGVQNADPTITKPADKYFTEGTNGNTITWIVTDSIVSTPYYIVYVNNTEWFADSWTSGVPIQVDIDDLEVGVYIFEIIAYDGLGGYVSDNVTVTVLAQANLAPLITSPMDQAINVSTTGNNITWIITDSKIGIPEYSITRNGNQIMSGIWINGTPIVLSIDGLSNGTYTFVITATDGLGATSSDRVIIVVFSQGQSNENPTITTPNDITYNLDVIGNVISWTITDAHIATTSYIITKNGTQIQSDTWTSGVAVTINIDRLSAGTYIFQITAYDGIGGNVTDTVTVIVIRVSPTSSSTTTTSSTNSNTTTTTPPSFSLLNNDINNQVQGYAILGIITVFATTIGIIVKKRTTL
jgi:hypothetical protein